MRYNKRVIIVMPETAPRVKFEITESFGAEIRTYDIARDHETGERGITGGDQWRAENDTQDKADRQVAGEE